MSYRKYLMPSDISPSELFKAVEVGTNLAEVGMDCISRQAAIEGKICIQRSNGVEIYDDYVVPVEYLKQLPPAQPEPLQPWEVLAAQAVLSQPERIKGHWIPVGGALYQCDQCGVVSLKRKFCSECGADMREL